MLTDDHGNPNTKQVVNSFLTLTLNGTAIHTNIGVVYPVTCGP